MRFTFGLGMAAGLCLGAALLAAVVLSAPAGTPGTLTLTVPGFMKAAAPASSYGANSGAGQTSTGSNNPQPSQSFSSELASIGVQPPVNDAVVLIPVAVAVLLGAVVFRSASNERSK